MDEKEGVHNLGRKSPGYPSVCMWAAGSGEAKLSLRRTKSEKTGVNGY